MRVQSRVPLALFWFVVAQNRLSCEKGIMKRGPGSQGKRLRWIIASLAFLISLSSGAGFLAGEIGPKPETGFLAPHAVAKGLIVPINIRAGPRPDAVLFVERITQEYKRYGFFRIGLLPQVAAEGMTLEIREISRAREVLVELSSFVPKSINPSEVPVRGFTVRVSGQSTPLIRAASMKIGPGEWELRDGVFAKQDSPPIRFEDASLQVAGAGVGRICCHAGDKGVACDLFAVPSLRP
jgi:hypothetical protein